MHRLVVLGATLSVAFVGGQSAAAAPPGWSGPTTVNRSQPPTAVSCPSVSFCMAVGTGGAAETFNGTAWSAPVVADPVGGLSAVSCPSAASCAAVGGTDAVIWGGSAWSAPVGVDTTRNFLGAVSCASAAFCVAGDGGGNGFVYNGGTWSAPITINHNSNQESIGGISCASSSFCVAAGQAGTIEISTNGGVAWSTPIQIGTNNLTSVSCPSSSFCVAVDTAGNAYAYNGTVWSAPTPVDTVNGQISGGALDSVSCASSSFCVAIDGRENVVMFNGSTWTAPASLESGASLRPGVACPSSSFCMAVDGGGSAFTFGAAAPPPTGPLPAPVLGKSVNAAPVAGVVFVRLAGAGSGDVTAGAAAAPGSGFVRLTAARQIPVGSEIDALHGSLKLVTAGARRHTTQSGTFRGAIFKVAQARRGASKGLSTLSLVEAAFKGAPTYALCARTRKSADASTAALSAKTLQLLHASAHGKFRTRGRYSAATVRGTTWSIADRCDGTLTHVVSGTVAVSDFVRHVTVVVHAGQSYLARASLKGK